MTRRVAHLRGRQHFDSGHHLSNLSEVSRTALGIHRMHCAVYYGPRLARGAVLPWVAGGPPMRTLRDYTSSLMELRFRPFPAAFTSL